MSAIEIQRQYNEVIAVHYDLDPQFITNRALANAIAHLEQESILAPGLPPMSVFDVGMGTGLFFDKLRKCSAREIQPFGLDMSEKMIEIAKQRIPDLTAVIDDAANIDRNFVDESFDMICTHFVTGFVPIDHLAPRIFSKLKPGGYWSFVGGTTGAYPELQRKGNSPLVRLLSRGKGIGSAKLITPRDSDVVVECFENHGFEVCSAEMFEPELSFKDFDEFMEFAYRGGWLTPFVEHLGLQNAKPLLKTLLNKFVFPVRDRHRIAIAWPGDLSNDDTRRTKPWLRGSEMRIALIAEVFLPKVDGVVVRTMNLIRQLLERGDEVLVVCPEVLAERNSPVPVVEFRSFPFPAYPEYRIGIPDARLLSTLADFKPDIVHFINPFAFGFRCYDILSRSELRVPTLFSFHTLYGEFVKRYAMMKPMSRLLWWLMRDYHNCADSNLTVSTIMQNDLVQRGFERVHFWPPAVDSALFHPDRKNDAMRNYLSGSVPEQPLLLTVSRLAPEKNVAFLAEVLEQLPGVRLAVIGDGPQRSELERRFSGLNANFVGYLKGQELAMAYASADAFVFASETETMGNVVLEAMASGLGVVAARAGGIPSLIRDGRTGLMFEPGNVSEAAGLVRGLLNDHELRSSLKHAARAQAADWDWNKSAERVREHYRNTIAEHLSDRGNVERRRRLAPWVLASLTLMFRSVAKISGRAPNGGVSRLQKLPI